MNKFILRWAVSNGRWAVSNGRWAVGDVCWKHIILLTLTRPKAAVWGDDADGRCLRAEGTLLYTATTMWQPYYHLLLTSGVSSTHIATEHLCYPTPHSLRSFGAGLLEYCASGTSFCDARLLFLPNFSKKHLIFLGIIFILLIFSDLKFSFYWISYMKNALLLQCTISLIQ